MIVRKMSKLTIGFKKPPTIPTRLGSSAHVDKGKGFLNEDVQKKRKQGEPPIKETAENDFIGVAGKSTRLSKRMTKNIEKTRDLIDKDPNWLKELQE